MNFNLNSPVFQGAGNIINLNGMLLPFEYTGPKSEYMAGRESAWLGLNLCNTPVYDVSGPDAVAFLEGLFVNHGFGKMRVGQSKHGLICNERGQLLADGVVMKKEGDVYRTYWLAPVLQYFVETSEMNVRGNYDFNEYFFQIDGPKSLEIMEEATQTDLHDLKFARNKDVKICGTDMTVHRLGMSGCLAYEVHGSAEYADVVYAKLREVVEKHGGRAQGVKNYSIINHTPAGYPNQCQHYNYPLMTSGEGLAEFAKKYCWLFPLVGSASEDYDAFSVTPYDVGWGYLVNFDHDFVGKDALLAIKANPPKKAVTLEWNTEDVGDVFMSQFRGKDVEPYDDISYTSQIADPTGAGTIRADWVECDGQKIGIASGRCNAFYERRMISLGFIAKEYAVEGRELLIRWGQPNGIQKMIRATVARFPYYNEEMRNETFDVEKIPHPQFD